MLRLQRSHGNRYVQRALAMARQGEGKVDVAPEIEAAIERERHDGQTLDRTARAQMEPFFGADFSAVRIHTGARADALNLALSARAFTTGRDIFFRESEYNPGNAGGRELLAHELTHVMQQGGKGVQRKLTIGLPDGELEQEANQAARAFLRRESEAALNPPHIDIARKGASGQLQAQVDSLTVRGTDSVPAQEKPAEKSPLERAKSLVTETPSSVEEKATWILTAADEGFVTFTPSMKTRENLEDVRDKKKVENLDPAAKAYDISVLSVEIGLIKSAAQRWIDAEGKGVKPHIQLGSFIRATADPHGKGRAIDINALDMTTSVNATIQIIRDLDKEIHGSYGIGLPFQGDFFDPDDDLEAMKKAAESSAAKGTEMVAPEANAEPPMLTVTDGIKKFTSHTWKSTGTLNNGKWSWKDKTQEAGGAYKLLKSQELKDAFAAQRKNGLSFTIFPDNLNHLHLDVR